MVRKAFLIAAFVGFSLTSLQARDRDDAFWGGIRSDRGVPIIMKGFRPNVPPSARGSGRSAARVTGRRRGSSTYIPPPMPSPDTPRATVAVPTVKPYQPPPINTFSDRVNDAIHAYPLDRGIGNNPTDQQQFIRQRVNQP